MTRDQPAPGDNGDKGDTGAEGDGFDELTQYGNIVVQYKGTDIDDNAFDQTVDFKFYPGGPEISWASVAWPYDNGEAGAGAEFQVYRFNTAAVSPTFSTNSYVGFSFQKANDNSNFTIYSSTNVIIRSADATTFSLDMYDSFPAAETVTDYSFNAATGELKFKFHIVVPAQNNETDHEIDISADVNVKVFTNVQTPS